MNKVFLLIFLALFSSASVAQTYTNADINKALSLIGITHSSNGKAFIDEYGEPVYVDHKEIDLNSDGRNELIVRLESNMLFPMRNPQGIAIFSKNGKACCSVVLPMINGIVGLLDTSTKGYRDLIIGGPGFQFPVYRWDGQQYVFSHTVSDKEFPVNEDIFP